MDTLLLFIASAGFIAYVLFGYPLLLAIEARCRRRPVRKELQERTVSILLPVRNGEAWIAKKLNSILNLQYPRELVQVIVVSDGSEDRTDEIVREFAADRIDLVRIPRSGKAAALNAGMERARGDLLFFTDVRQPLDPESLRNLVACFADPSVGVASGELLILNGKRNEEASIGLYWQYEKWIRKRQGEVDSILGATGCIYLMRRGLAAPLPANSLLDDVNLPLGAFFRGYRVIFDETAIAYDYPTSLETEFRRKVRTLAGVYQTIRLFPALLGRSNRMWLHFMSHKLGRLLVPFAMVLMAAASFGLPQPWAAGAVALQAGFYGTALLDRWIPDRAPAKRLTSLVRTFVVLMAAAFCAASILFAPHRDLWKETRGSAAKAAF
jgi:cellulose synthase/poly-beta-1,6-N-acetylglucosamine synthase-like glycosyltransferase